MTNFIIDLIEYLIQFFHDTIPTFDFDTATYSNISNAIVTVTEFLSNVNFIIPLPDIAAIIVISIGMRLFKFGLFAGNWIVRRICDLLP